MPVSEQLIEECLADWWEFFEFVELDDWYYPRGGEIVVSLQDFTEI